MHFFKKLLAFDLGASSLEHEDALHKRCYPSGTILQAQLIPRRISFYRMAAVLVGLSIVGVEDCSSKLEKTWKNVFREALLDWNFSKGGMSRQKISSIAGFCRFSSLINGVTLTTEKIREIILARSNNDGIKDPPLLNTLSSIKVLSLKMHWRAAREVKASAILDAVKK